jgi:hypothetical protein
MLEELRQREPIFLRPEFDSIRADFERMTADDFWAIEAFGNGSVEHRWITRVKIVLHPGVLVGVP